MSFVARQKITTEDGKLDIRTLYLKYKNGEKVPKVLVYDEVTKDTHFDVIRHAIFMRDVPLIRIKVSNYKIVYSTSDHQYLTMAGWKTTEDIRVGDCILANTPSHKSFMPIPNEDQMQMVFGGIVGDSPLVKEKSLNSCSVRLCHGVDQKDYVMWKASMFGSKAIEQLRPNEPHKTTFGGTLPVFYLKDLKCTKAHVIDNLTWKSVAISWMDDGTLTSAQNGGRMMPVATSLELSNRYADKITSMGIPCRVGISKGKEGKEYYYIGFVKESIYKLSEMIAPYVHNNLRYKIVDKFKHLVGTYKWDDKFLTNGAAVVLEKSLILPRNVYNIYTASGLPYLATPENKLITSHVTPGLITK